MKIRTNNYNYNFSPDKNKKLIEERQISFEEIIVAIEEGLVLDVLEHPNRDKYNNQKIYVVEINHYVYLVPFVKEDSEIFLKTIIPSRKATRLYLRGNINEH